jgi:hypothetical protein
VILVLLAAAALAADPVSDDEIAPTCSVEALAALPTPPDRLAVAWVSRRGHRPRGWLDVVPAADLGGWLAAQDPPWTGRTLQYLGLRKKGTDPRRRWKVVVMDVERSELCRPVDGVEPGTDVAGVPACAARLGRPGKHTAGCGRTLDRKTSNDALARYAVRRSEGQQRGYCVVPLERYVQGAGR